MSDRPFVTVLKTLPLALSGVVLGMMLAAADYHVDWKAACFLLLAVSCLHILANVKNIQEYEPDSYKVLSWILLILAIACGLTTVYLSFGSLFLLESFILMIFGYFAVNSALRRTIGVNPLSSRRLTPVYSFVFLGPLSVLGTYYICAHTFSSWLILLPAASVGLFSMLATDAGRKPLFMLLLIVGGWTAAVVYSCLRMFDIWHFCFVLTLPLFIWYLITATKRNTPDQPLALLYVSIFAFTVLTGLGYLVFLF